MLLQVENTISKYTDVAKTSVNSRKFSQFLSYNVVIYQSATIQSEMAYQNLRNEYLNMPPVTRAYTTACVITTLAVQLELASPFQLYFNPILIIKQGQVWRLVTTFLFFGTFGFNFFFNMIFTYRYCRMLEEGSFRNRTADFVLMFMFGAVCMIAFAFFVNLIFLGQAFTIMLVYVWSRRNPYVRMNFFGLLNFQAPYLPWILLAFSVLLGNAVYVDLMGIAVGHIYYFLEDVFPNQRGGFKILKTPSLLKTLCDPAPEDVDYQRLPEERPGGFEWGNQNNAEQEDQAEEGQADNQQQQPDANDRQ